MKTLKRVFIIIWVPGFTLAMLLAFCLGPFVWALTGTWPHEWLFDHMEPFDLAEEWGLTKS
jgi:hypothetical protein